MPMQVNKLWLVKVMKDGVMTGYLKGANDTVLEFHQYEAAQAMAEVAQENYRRGGGSNSVEYVVKEQRVTSEWLDQPEPGNAQRTPQWGAKAFS
jgi:hypothetical protein